MLISIVFVLVNIPINKAGGSFPTAALSAFDFEFLMIAILGRGKMESQCFDLHFSVGQSI